jgi:fibronectin-binding autotransporter adhesin
MSSPVAVASPFRSHTSTVVRAWPALFAALFLAVTLSSAHAAFTTWGEVIPADPSMWTNSTTAYIGITSGGILTVDGDSDLLSNCGYIGYGGPATGVVNISGTGSTWTNSGSLHVGDYGSGTLNITNGGSVSNTNTLGSVIGYNSGSTGTVTVDGAGSTWTSNGDLIVGHSGSGTLSISGGGAVSSSDAYIGIYADSIGVVTVSGPNSTWTNSGHLYVGGGMAYDDFNYVGGSGTLKITNGGCVSNTMGFIGDKASSTGVVTVSGSGSKWLNSSALYVGCFNNGTLNIADGGAVSNTNGYVGGVYGVFMGDRSPTGAVTVSGSGSTWTNTGKLFVGYYGNGTLNITNGGTVSSTDGDICFYPRGDTGTVTGVVTVTGANSTWTNSGSLTVGEDGNAILNVRDGGCVSNTSGEIGNASGFVGGSASVVTVSGAGSKWTNTGDLLVRGSLSITGGGAVSNRDGTIGDFSSTSAVTVSGSGSKWTNTGSLAVGFAAGGAMNIVSGGSVSCTSGTILAGEVTVNGPGSTWSNSSDLSIGGFFSSGTLNIINGGAVSVARTTYFVSSTGSTGVINFGTTGGTLTTQSLMASPSLLAGTGTIIARGLVADISLMFNLAHGLEQTITLNSLAGQNVTVNLNMSTAANNGILGAGCQGAGSLTIQNGIAVTSTDGYVGYNAGSTGVATVSGTGSKWSTKSHLYVGLYGSGTLAVSNGGTVYSSHSGNVGYYSGSTGTVTISGSGSTWTNWTDLCVGGGTNPNNTGGSGSLTITNGGAVSNQYGYIGYGRNTSGMVTVDGVGSKWTNGGGLYVAGSLSITNGGCVTSTYDGTVGNSSGSPGLVTVNGAGSTWTTGSGLVVGYSGIGGVTQTGGNVVVGGTLLLGRSSAGNGTYNLNGGLLALQNLQGGAGTATFNFGGGVLRADANFASTLPMTLTGTGGNATVDTQTYAVSFSDILSGAGGLNKVGGGTLTLAGANNYNGTTTVVGGTIKLVGTSLAVPGAWNPVLNLGGADIQHGWSKIVFDYSGAGGSDPATTILGLLTASYNSGAWNTGKFRSTTAATTGLTLGWRDDGSSTVIVMATYPGDFNLNGVVDNVDRDIWLAHAFTGTTWQQGDANYDGVVNGLDRDLWFAHVGMPPIAGLPAPAGITPAPEPGTLALLASGLFGLLAVAWRKRG